jgi:arginine kinase
MNFDQFPLFADSSTSLLKKYLSREIFDDLKDLKTSNGYTLIQAINSGVVNQDSNIGIYAGDAESYATYAAVFNPIISDYHGFDANDSHVRRIKSETLQCSDPDPDNQYILSTRIRVGRNVAEMPLGPAVTNTQRNQIENQIVSVLESLSGELSGHYYPITGMSSADRMRLVEDHFLFKQGDRFLDAAGLNRDWPQGRGIYHNNDKTFLVWINEEDHMRIISMEQGGSIQSVFNRLFNAVSLLEDNIPFLYDERLGYLTSCPTNLGTAMRASVHIFLPLLGKNMKRLHEIADHYHLQIRGIHGEHSESEGGVFDISNRRRLGVSEIDCVKDLHSGVLALIEEEKKNM